jgi:dolichol-phosphate mannosyltransferase
VKLSFVIPVFNEENNIIEIYQRCKDVLPQVKTNAYEFVFINDGSVDGSMSRIQDLVNQDSYVKYLDLSRNFGQQIALSAGLDYCTGNQIVIMDADLQDPPECIPAMLTKLEEGYDVVYARRASRKGESWIKRITAKWFYRIFNLLVHIDMPLDTGDFRVIQRNVVDVLKQMPEQQKFLRGQIAWMGFNQTYIEYERPERIAGQTGYTFRKMLRLALDGITSFSDYPLRIVTLSGFIFSFVAFLGMLYALYSKFILKDFVQGWTSIMISVLFIGGVQLIAIGILGAYISRLHQNTRNRPLYIVKDSNL